MFVSLVIPGQKYRSVSWIQRFGWRGRSPTEGNVSHKHSIQCLEWFYHRTPFVLQDDSNKSYVAIWQVQYTVYTTFQEFKEVSNIFERNEYFYSAKSIKLIKSESKYFYIVRKQNKNILNKSLWIFYSSKSPEKKCTSVSRKY